MFRKIFFVLLLSGICKISDAQVIVKTNLVYPVFAGGLSMGLENKTYPKSTTGLYLSCGQKDNFLWGLLRDYTFYNILVEQRFYLSEEENPLDGFYVGPYLKGMYRNYFRNGTQENYLYHRDDKELKGFSLGLGMLLGYQLPLNRNFSIDFFGGTGYSYYIVQEVSYGAVKRAGFVDMRLGLCIGYKIN